MRAKRHFRTGLTLAVIAAVGIAAPLHADDEAVLGNKLQISVGLVSGKVKLSSIQKGLGVHFGGGTNPGLLSATFEAYYVDTPSNRSVLSIPAPWTSIKGVTAKFQNKLAPSGPTVVKNASIKYASRASLSAVGLGGISIATPPGPGGVLTIFSITNGNDASSHRLCSLYAVAHGSFIRHKATPTNTKLQLKRGVVVACPTCNDGIQNHHETGVDCGGDLCPACGPGPTCSDGIQNQGETGVDCGGPCPPCVGPTCSDGTKNGAETDVDCGGGTCPDCGPGDDCALGTDCIGGVCTSGTCQPTCTDGVKNAAETDVDCGGGTCPQCGAGDTCSVPSDCTTGVCQSGTCQIPTCTDGAQNGSETDVDCGGSCAADCAFGQGCALGNDCVTTHCSGGFCKCASNLYTFTVNSNSGGLFDSAEWPGGTTTQSAATSCSVTINRPNNNIDLVCSTAAPFSVNSFVHYSNCVGTGGEDGDGCQPVSCPPAGIGQCCNGRPSCSAALNGSGSARYFVQWSE
jgi:hypothetical protein